MQIRGGARKKNSVSGVRSSATAEGTCSKNVKIFNVFLTVFNMDLEGKLKEKAVKNYVKKS